MGDHEREFMKEAIKWANGCQPIKDSIPKVGAIIAEGQETLGRGRRGTGEQGDDDHAELHAILDVKDKSALARSTLYTTLEPCTMGVRTNPLECCTEQIRQYQIKRVFVGILDPNQGVTGKGLWRLQDTGVEVALFPHDLSEEIRAQNAAFIRSQQTLGAKIISPKNGEELRTYETSGKHPVRFSALNPPGPETCLLSYKEGLYWPQGGSFRQVEPRVWEIDAHFGSVGDHELQLVTANELAGVLIGYYRKVVELNRIRREKLRGKIDMSLLGGDYPGIQMNGLPKGLRLEDSVKIKIAYKVSLVATSVEPKTIPRGKTLKITYEIECSEDVSSGIWIGACFRDGTGKYFFNVSQDKAIPLKKGKSTHERSFTIAKDAPLGEQMLETGVWRGVVGDSGNSKHVTSRPPLSITVVE